MIDDPFLELLRTQRPSISVPLEIRSFASCASAAGLCATAPCEHGCGLADRWRRRWRHLIGRALVGDGAA